MPIRPTKIQKALSKVYAESFFNTAHHVSITASIVLNIQTNINGLSGPIQLTSVKLKIRITTPDNSAIFMCAATNLFSIEKSKTYSSRRTTLPQHLQVAGLQPPSPQPQAVAAAIGIAAPAAGNNAADT